MFRRREPIPSISAWSDVRGKPNATFRSSANLPAFAHPPCRPLILPPAACFAAGRKQRLPSHDFLEFHATIPPACPLQTSRATARSGFLPAAAAPPSPWLPSSPGQPFLPHPSPPRPSLPGAHPDPYTCHASLALLL